jgi:Uma2 family endonuclease
VIPPSLRDSLPSTTELPCSDDTPVDNVGISLSRSEDQNLLPNLLLLLLTDLWAKRMDWFFGIDMAAYHTTGISPKVPVVPDAFLSLNVELQQEVLTWYDAQGNRHLSAVEQEQQRRARLEAFLRTQGFDPDHLPDV